MLVPYVRRMNLYPRAGRRRSHTRARTMATNVGEAKAAWLWCDCDGRWLRMRLHDEQRLDAAFDTDPSRTDPIHVPVFGSRCEPRCPAARCPKRM